MFLQCKGMKRWYLLPVGLLVIVTGWFVWAQPRTSTLTSSALTCQGSDCGMCAPGGNAGECPFLNLPCISAACNTNSDSDSDLFGVCSYNVAPDGTSCGTGNQCLSGTCVPIECATSPNGTVCGQGMVCQNAICVNACQSNTDCSDGNSCTSDVCSGGVCSNPSVSNGTSCNGSNGICQNGNCQNVQCTVQNAATNCNDSNPCTADSCANNACSNTAVANGTACPDDGNPCTADACSNGSCAHPLVAAGTSCGTNMVCNSGGQCVQQQQCTPGSGPCCLSSGMLAPAGTGCSSGANQCPSACTGNSVSCPAVNNYSLVFTSGIDDETKKPMDPFSKGLPGVQKLCPDGTRIDTSAEYDVSGLPGTTTSFEDYSLSVDGQTITGKIPVGAANGGVAWWQRIFAQLLGQNAGGPNPDGREYSIDVTATDSNGQTAEESFNLQVDPLRADAQVTNGSACFDGEQNLDIHANNAGPDPAPGMSIEAEFDNVQYNGDIMSPVVLNAPAVPGGNLSGPAMNTQVSGNTVTWNAGGTPVPAGGEAAAWPAGEITSGNEGQVTATVSGQYFIDPNPENNTATKDITSECSPIEITPDGPICEDTSLLIVAGMGAGSMTIPLGDCLDPSTVNALIPSQCQVQGNSVVCNGVTATAQNPTVMVSFTVNPKADCAPGSTISAQANYTATTGTNRTLGPDSTGPFCPCDEKGVPDCSSSRSSRRSSSSRSSLSSRSSSRSSAASSRSSSASRLSASSTSVSVSARSLSSIRSSVSSRSSATSVSSGSSRSSAPSSRSSVRTVASSAGDATSSLSTFSSSLGSAGSASSASSVSPILTLSSSSSSLSLSIILPSSFAPGTSGFPVPGENIVYVAGRDPLPVPSPLCGNNRLDGDEECDDGNNADFDGCSAFCLFERGTCGDGTVQTLLGEQCEPTVPSALGCRDDCKFLLNSCGNGRKDAGESCDDGALNSNLPGAACRPDCSPARCGDRILDPAESCDDGNRLNGDGCDSFCRVERGGAQSQGTLPATVIDLPLTTPQQGACISPTDCASGLCLNGRCEERTISSPVSSQRDTLPTPPPTTSESGPAALAMMSAGAAAGYAWVRRRRG